MYFLAINRAKPDTNPESLSDVIPHHIAWVKERLSTGELLQAGKWGPAGGMCILAATDVEEARSLVSSDPLVESGLFSVEIGEFWPDAHTVQYA